MAPAALAPVADRLRRLRDRAAAARSSSSRGAGGSRAGPPQPLFAGIPRRGGGRDGQRVVIVGASSGIGRGVALAFAGRGARLLLAARSRSDLAAVQAECRAAGAAACAIAPTDVTRAADCAALQVAAARDLAGGVDLLVLAAGIGCHQTEGSAWGTDAAAAEAYERTMAVNFFGCMAALRALLPLLQERKGHIVVMSSASALVGLPSRAAYCASKAALHAGVEALVADARWDVTVTEVFAVSISGTRLREKGIRVGGSGAAPAEHTGAETEVPAEQVVERVVAAADARQRRVYMPAKLRLLPVLKHSVPARADALLERMVWRKSRL
eukprot:TRINITY_DN115_c0_g1_i1.p1 TRINITY_DN115_c0_g1~~TRINITY_DN115_c0_g1_i1.p1  ORF type:complete len:351 (+),score=104.26 TRINITY_DN115_c0_g1_i1:74-1054(+)